MKPRSAPSDSSTCRSRSSGVLWASAGINSFAIWNSDWYRSIGLTSAPRLFEHRAICPSLHSPRRTMSDTPERIGSFRILGVMGRGGMGIVYRGVHETTGLETAIKTVRDAHGDFVQSLRRE